MARAEQEIAVYGRDRSLFTLPMDRTGRRTPETVEEFRARLRSMVVRTREASEARRLLDLRAAVYANLYKPARPQAQAVRFVASPVRAKHYAMREVIDAALVDAVRTEMHRRDIGDLCGSRLEEELIEMAADALTGESPVVQADRIDEAARCVVRLALDAGAHELERARQTEVAW